MIKRIITIFALLLILTLSLCGCGEKKTLHCDNCGIEVKADADSNMEEDWIIYCEDCNEELFGDDPVLGAE